MFDLWNRFQLSTKTKKLIDQNTIVKIPWNTCQGFSPDRKCTVTYVRHSFIYEKSVLQIYVCTNVVIVFIIVVIILVLVC